MTTSDAQQVSFPVGYFKFHQKQLFNFQLNRWHSLGFTRFEDIETIGNSIKTFQDWKLAMLQLAEKAISENRLMNAAFYYRAAEFYTFDDSGEKESLYNTFREYFQLAFQKDAIEYTNIPYKAGFLPSLRISPVGKKRGTIMLHGGFDSFLEEWYFMMKYLAAHDYEVIGFEGPGQGAALRRHGLAFEVEWEKPVQAVLEHYHVNDATLFGLSMGGWLCLRAAAFEPRITRVIASGHAIDYMKCFPYLVRIMHLWLVKQTWLEGFMHTMAMKKAQANNAQGWITHQLMYITRKNDPMEAFEAWLALNEENMHADRVIQDVLLLSGRNDHFIPRKMHRQQITALINAKSITDKVFTQHEHAHNHCQIGNIQLLLDVITDWLKRE